MLCTLQTTQDMRKHRQPEAPQQMRVVRCLLQIEPQKLEDRSQDRPQVAPRRCQPRHVKADNMLHAECKFALRHRVLYSLAFRANGRAASGPSGWRRPVFALVDAAVLPALARIPWPLTRAASAPPSQSPASPGYPRDCNGSTS